jgi:hypothetical protein
MTNEQRPAENKMKYSMTSHFRKLEQNALKNLDNFSQNFNIKGEQTEPILIKLDPDDFKNETINPLADWHFESSSVKIEPNSECFLVAESTTAKSEPVDMMEGSTPVKKKIKIDPVLKRRSPMKTKKEKKRRIKKEVKKRNYKDDGKKVCELCGKAFTGSLMVYHMNAHLGKIC